MHVLPTDFLSLICSFKLHSVYLACLTPYLPVYQENCQVSQICLRPQLISVSGISLKLRIAALLVAFYTLCIITLFLHLV